MPGTEVKLISADDVLLRFAGFLRKREAEDRYPVMSGFGTDQRVIENAGIIMRWGKDHPDDKELPTLLKLLGSMRSYLLIHLGEALRQCSRPSELVERFARTIKDKADPLRLSDPGYADLGKLVGAVLEFARTFGAWDLLKDGPVGIALTPAGFKAL